MPKHLPSYDLVTTALAPVLNGLPPKVIAIAGPMHAGKSTLSRFLAWHFNVTLIETDPFMTHGGPPIRYRSDEIKTLIDFRLRLKRPVIVEGVAVLRLLSELAIKPDFVVSVSSARTSASAVDAALESLSIVLRHPEDGERDIVQPCNG